MDEEVCVFEHVIIRCKTNISPTTIYIAGQGTSLCTAIFFIGEFIVFCAFAGRFVHLLEMFN